MENVYELPSVIELLIKQLNCRAGSVEATLQEEENGSKIAKLQGFLAGVKSYKQTLKDAGFIVGADLETEKMAPWIIESANKNQDDDEIYDVELNFTELTRIVIDLDTFESMDFYEELRKKKVEKIDKMKDQLFYYSEKGRELYWCKGWYEAYSLIKKWTATLRSELSARERDRKNSLPFGED